MMIKNLNLYIKNNTLPEISSGISSSPLLEISPDINSSPLLEISLDINNSPLEILPDIQSSPLLEILPNINSSLEILYSLVNINIDMLLCIPVIAVDICISYAKGKGKGKGKEIDRGGKTEQVKNAESSDIFKKPDLPKQNSIKPKLYDKLYSQYVQNLHLDPSSKRRFNEFPESNGGHLDCNDLFDLRFVVEIYTYPHASCKYSFRHPNPAKYAPSIYLKGTDTIVYTDRTMLNAAFI